MGRVWKIPATLISCRGLRKVIDGEDKGGITEAVAGRAAGAFAITIWSPSLIEIDRWGTAIIFPEIQSRPCWPRRCASTWASSMPRRKSRRTIGARSFVRKRFYLCHHRVADGGRASGDFRRCRAKRTLLVCCKAFDAKAGSFDNLTCKKIPQAGAGQLRMGARDDYSFRNIGQIAGARMAGRGTRYGWPSKDERTEEASRDTTPSLFDKGGLKGKW